jgi:hypothetical protein
LDHRPLPWLIRLAALAAIHRCPPGSIAHVEVLVLFLIEYLALKHFAFSDTEECADRKQASIEETVLLEVVVGHIELNALRLRRQ